MRIAVLLFALVAVVSGAVLGDRYISRMPSHAGYWLVRVEDRVAAPPPRVGRTVMIVVDGLRRDKAVTMKSAQRLARRGQCRASDQGDYTVSRPVYSMLSTGLEADRTGSRNNDLETPLAAESFWEVARRAGLAVRASSHLPWWQQLFPSGFTTYRHTPEHDTDVFASTREEDARFDVDLFHPLYVDEMGHLHGGASAEYAAAVTRVDGEIAGLLDRLDLDLDDVILTADHGHRDEGGHGGAQPEIREVLVCFAGPHVRQAEASPPLETRHLAPFDGRLTAPLLSLLAGVAFPAHMRAGEDHLDDLWNIVKLDPAFEADRRAAITRFRVENERKVGSWAQVYARERHAQWLRIALVSIAMLAFVGLRVRRSPRDVLWLLGTLGAFWLAHHAVLGDFDYTVINRKAVFVPRAFLAAIVAVAASVGLNRALSGGLHERLFIAVVLVMLANAGHVFVYGWPLGFPLPGAAARYLPFFLAFAQVVLAVGYGISGPWRPQAKSS